LDHPVARRGKTKFEEFSLIGTRMKNTMCLALIIMAILPASAQKAGGQECFAIANAIAQVTHDYAAQVDGVLRDVHARLEKISAQVAAGRLTSEHGQELKLAATRDAISRLDALAAVYDARLQSKESSGMKTGPVVRAASSTVSVEELKLERASPLASCAQETIR
jgi:hypothetical protein